MRRKTCATTPTSPRRCRCRASSPRRRTRASSRPPTSATATSSSPRSSRPRSGPPRSASSTANGDNHERPQKASQDRRRRRRLLCPHAIDKNAMKRNGKHSHLQTHVSVWRHHASKATRAIIKANSGKVLDKLLVPQNTRHFASYLLKIQQIKPDVVSTAVGGDDIKA